MTELSSVDYPNKRIHLHSDTMTSGVSIALYQEVFADWLATAANQNYRLPLDAEGYEPKTGSKKTPRRMLLGAGWRLVPYDASHILQLLIELLNKADVLENIQCFDRSGLSAGTDVDIDTTGIDKVEVVTITIAGSVSQDAIDAIKLQTDKFTFTGSDVNASATVAIDSDAIATAVWEKSKAGAVAGSYGEAILTIETDAGLIRTDVSATGANVVLVLDDTNAAIPSTLSALGTLISAVGTVVDSIKTDTNIDIPATLTAIKAKSDQLVFTGSRLDATIGEDLLLGAVTWSKAMGVAAAGAGGGTLSGAGTDAETFGKLDASGAEFVVTADEEGNRTAINLNP